MTVRNGGGYALNKCADLAAKVLGPALGENGARPTSAGGNSLHRPLADNEDVLFGRGASGSNAALGVGFIVPTRTTTSWHPPPASSRIAAKLDVAVRLANDIGRLHVGHGLLESAPPARKVQEQRCEAEAEVSGCEASSGVYAQV